MKVSKRMDQSDIAKIRLSSQQLVMTKFLSPQEIVSWMGAMQAQDYPMAKWAIGVRLPGSTDQDIEAAIANAEIIRTHLLRPTWHFVAAEDVYWMIDLTAAQVKAAQSSRERDLELTEQVFAKSNTTIEKALTKGRHLNREELITELNKAGIVTDQNRAAHLLARAELEKIICNGTTLNGKTTYALLADRVRKIRHLSRDEALAELAKRYFNSRCPASLQDFTWWSGLQARDANRALELVKSEFSLEKIEGHSYWLPPDFTLFPNSLHSVYLLPTYDEFILSYTDRSASIPPHLQLHMKEISDRGVFRPIIVIDGQVTGIWKRTIRKDMLVVELELFSPPDSLTQHLIEEAAHQVGGYLDKKVELYRNF